jgi:hypothetical protein
LSVSTTVKLPLRPWKATGTPALGLVGNEVNPPFRPGVGAGLPGLAVGGVVTRHDETIRAVRERDVQAIVREGIGVGDLVALRAVEGQRQRMPLLHRTAKRRVVGRQRRAPTREDQNDEDRQNQSISLHIQAPYRNHPCSIERVW